MTRRLIAHPPFRFPHPRADAAATEYGADNRCPPMAETIVWACPATYTLSRRSSGSTRARHPPNDGVEVDALIDECAFHSAGSSGDLPDLHGAHEPSTLSLLLDTVVG